MKSTDLKRIVRRIRDLPTLPRTVLRITELINNPRSSASDLAGVITDDQVLTARLLRLVNSAFYGFPQQISTVTRAIVLIGFDAIRNLLLTTSVFDLFAKTKAGDQQKLEKFWDHSMACAVGAKVIANHLRYEKVEELFVAGLLHDIGKIIEMLYLQDDFARVEALVMEENILMVRAEEKLLAYTHAEVGRLLAERWNLPAKLANAISYHHQPDLAAENAMEASIVHLTDIFARALNVGSGGDSKMPALNPSAWELLQIKPDAIGILLEGIEKEFQEIDLSLIVELNG